MSDRSPDEPEPGSANEESTATESEQEPPGTEAGASDPEDAPLSELARRVADRRERETAGDPEDASIGDLDVDPPEDPPTEGDDDPFERMSVGEIDEEELWSSLESQATGDAEVSEAVPPGSVGPASGVETVGNAAPETREHVVAKETYCQSCPYLDDPPALSCTHEGTEIVEVVDSDRFRVRNCPMIGESTVEE